MKKYHTPSCRLIDEDTIIREYVDQDWDTQGELELMKARIDRITELLANCGSQMLYDYAIRELRLEEVKW